MTWRLGTDWIDLYQVHRPTPNTDLAETLGAFTNLVHHGKVRYIGHSFYPAFTHRRSPDSVLIRGVENEVLPVCQRCGIGVIPGSPLQGMLAVWSLSEECRHHRPALQRTAAAG